MYQHANWKQKQQSWWSMVLKEWHSSETSAASGQYKNARHHRATVPKCGYLCARMRRHGISTNAHNTPILRRGAAP